MRPNGLGLSPAPVLLGASISPPNLLGVVLDAGAAASTENWLLKDLVEFNGEIPCPPSTVHAKLELRGAALGGGVAVAPTPTAAVAAAVAPAVELFFLMAELVLFSPKAARILSNLLGFGVVPPADFAFIEGEASIPSCLLESFASAAMVAARRIDRCCSRSYAVIATNPAS